MCPCERELVPAPPPIGHAECSYEHRREVRVRLGQGALRHPSKPPLRVPGALLSRGAPGWARGHVDDDVVLPNPPESRLLRGPPSPQKLSTGGGQRSGLTLVLGPTYRV